jgi:hypothetical protein
MLATNVMSKNWKNNNPECYASHNKKVQITFYGGF